MRITGIVGIFCAACAVQAQSVEGVWQSQGYGYVFEIKGEGLSAFEVTAQTCLPGFTAKLDPAAVPGRLATFRTGDGEVFFVRTGGDADHRLMHADGSASDMRIHRLPARPKICATPTADTPAGNFDVFARSWAENYISFDLKHADWDKVVAGKRAQVTSGTSPAALFDLMESMIAPFGDAHTFINAPGIKREFHGLRPGTDRVAIDMVGDGGLRKFRKEALPKLLAITEQDYVQGALRMYCNRQLQYGPIDDATGYLRILSFSGYAEGGYAEGAAALEKALDEIFSGNKLRALVIDVRINFGGDDPYGLAIASRLATSQYLAYTKKARADAVQHDNWTPGDSSIVKPSTRPGFRGPVVLLTGPLTISAGETFTQALMGRTPHVTRMGENTQGVFSDVLDRHMPNGWSFGLPNEVYLTPDGKAFDGPGIPPEVQVPVFAAADVKARKDPAMAAALDLLKKAK